jgi:hypothetical protein
MEMINFLAQLRVELWFRFPLSDDSYDYQYVVDRSGWPFVYKPIQLEVAYADSLWSFRMYQP